MGFVVITTSGLTKRFGKLVAVDSLDLEIGKGEIFALLGPNGAGKTTTISMLCGLLHPSSGSASVNGFDVRDRPLDVRKSIGIVFQSPSIDDLLTGGENLELHGLLYGMDRNLRKTRMAEVLELVGLAERADDQVKTYSGGMRKRIEIARGLMHRPKVLFLDEPTIGLDPQTRSHIWSYIKDLSKSSNITVLLTTHYMEEAETLADRVGIIDNGKLIALGTPDKLKRGIGSLDLVIVKGGEGLSKRIGRLKFVKGVSEEKGNAVIRIENAGKNLCRLLEKIGPVEEVEVRKPTLNDVFIHYTGRAIHGEKGEGGMFERIIQQEGRRQ